MNTLIVESWRTLKHALDGFVGHGVVVTLVDPNATFVAWNPAVCVPKFEPVMVRIAPPASAPLDGESEVTVGKFVTYV